MRITSLIGILLLSLCLQVFAATGTDRAYILTIADIHFDPFAYCNTSPCPLISKLQQADVSQWPVILKTQSSYMPRFKQDTNFTLLTSTLKNFKQVSSNENPRFVLILGDFIGHDFRYKFAKFTKDKSQASYQAFVFKTLNFLSNELNQTFVNTDSYSVVGNNDSYQNDYQSNPGGAFFYDVAKLWARSISNVENRNSMQAQFSKAGYYALTLPAQNNLRLIVLNTNLFSYHARAQIVDQAAQTQLIWLHQQLQTAKDNHQKVLIAMHIPPGIDLYQTFTVVNLWKQKYVDAYNAELNTFSSEIMGVFAGHLHADWFQALTLNTNILPITGTPAVSPIYGTNPGFKIYTYAPGQNSLTGFTTHQYPLSYRRISVIETSFNLSQNLRCENSWAPDVIQQTSLLANITSQFLYSDKTQAEAWSAYYHCVILK